MTMLGLSLAYIRAKPLASALNLLLLALGIATIVVLLLFSQRLGERLTRDARDIDLVVGAKGSPIQLILSAIYHVDQPTGNIPLSFAESLRRQPMIKQVIPLALGDSAAGFRVVGTEPAYAALYDAEVADGVIWRDPFQAVLGADAARATGLKVGDQFDTTHGLAGEGARHEETPYTVVGIFAQTDTVIDRLILTSIDSLWRAHDPSAHPLMAGRAGTDRAPSAADLEVTALLVRYASPMAAVMVPRQINAGSALQAAAPAAEVTRLLGLIGIGLATLRGFALLLVCSAALGVFIALYNAMQERRYDLAIMRSLGARPATLFRQVITEGLILSCAGTAVGMALGHLVTEVLAHVLPEAGSMGVTGLAWAPEEIWLLALAVGVGLVSSLLPAWQAYRTDVAETLAHG